MSSLSCLLLFFVFHQCFCLFAASIKLQTLIDIAYWREGRNIEGGFEGMGRYFWRKKCGFYSKDIFRIWLCNCFFKLTRLYSISLLQFFFSSNYVVCIRRYQICNWDNVKELEPLSWSIQLLAWIFLKTACKNMKNMDWICRQCCPICNTYTHAHARTRRDVHNIIVGQQLIRLLGFCLCSTCLLFIAYLWLQLDTTISVWIII